MERNIDSYIAIDLETSGLQPKTDKIIEIGAWKIVDGEAVESFQTFVNPYRQITARITELTGITSEMVADAPGVDQVIESVIHFCGDLPLLGHRVIFDYSFLKRAAVNRGLTFEKEGIDTLKLCRLLMPLEAKKSLAAACSFYQIRRDDAHRALSDARDAHHLYQCLLKTYRGGDPGLFGSEQLIYKVKREQPATKKQKEGLRELVKYHRIEMSVDIDYLTRNEISRMSDKIVSQYGRIS